jgi:hypothetical protein
MKHTMHRFLMGGAVALLGTVAAYAQSATGTTNLQVTVAHESSISVTTGTTALANGGSTLFANPYTGTTSFTYKVRTTQATGSGSVTVKVTTDFGAGGPSVTTPPTAGDALSYTCTSASGTACATAQTASTAASTNVVTFGADAHSSAAAGDAGSVSWSLTDDPVYKTGAYTATVTFTIAST